MTGHRPWWASDGPVDGGVDAAEDPVERFRAARRGGAAGPTTPGPDPAADDGDLPFDDQPAGTGAAGGPGGPDQDVPDAGPWWEAAAETVSRLARDLAETAEAHEPRDGARPDGPRERAQPGQDASTTGRFEGPAGSPEGEPAAHRVDACGVCPICVGLRALGETRPELVGHLAEAARHVALAARSLGARSTPAPGADEPLQRIDLDE